MIPESDMLKYGALGFGFLVLLVIIWLIVRPIILAFVAEIRESRKERTEQREQFLGFMENHAAGQVEALHQVRDGLREERAGLREVKMGLREVATSLHRLNGRERQK